MVHRSGFAVLAIAIVLLTAVGSAQAEEKKYPNWKGEWTAAVPRMPGQQLRFDPSKPYAKGQEAPLTEEYQRIYQANLKELELGRQGLFLYRASCLPAGMPTMMSIGDFEFIITTEITYIVAPTTSDGNIRHVFTDGRPWPTEIEPTYQGYSIGSWVDEDGDGT